MKVMRQHRDAAYKISDSEAPAEYIVKAARED